jgi:hypothetical protein
MEAETMSMIDQAQAREIAQKWLDTNCRIEDDRFLIRDEFTKEHSFGWVFCYHCERWLQTRDFKYEIAGNVPLIVDRTDGSVHVTGTARRLEHYISEYKRNRKTTA